MMILPIPVHTSEPEKIECPKCHHLFELEEDAPLPLVIIVWGVGTFLFLSWLVLSMVELVPPPTELFSVYDYDREEKVLGWYLVFCLSCVVVQAIAWAFLKLRGNGGNER